MTHHTHRLLLALGGLTALLLAVTLLLPTSAPTHLPIPSGKTPPKSIPAPPASATLSSAPRFQLLSPGDTSRAALPRKKISPHPVVRPATLPIVLAEPDPQLQLTPEQTTAWIDLQNDFLQTIQTERQRQKPTDPAALLTWQRAQTTADERFLAQFGQEIYLAQQRHASETR